MYVQHCIHISEVNLYTVYIYHHIECLQFLGVVMEQVVLVILLGIFVVLSKVVVIVEVVLVVVEIVLNILLFLL